VGVPEKERLLVQAQGIGKREKRKKMIRQEAKKGKDLS
jgi:hypothetical protein